MAGTNTTPEPANIDKFAYLKALRGHPLLNGKSGTQLIIRIMVDYADAKTLGSARPAVSTLAADAGMGRTAAKAALHSAIELGFLRVEKEATNRTPAVYSLHMPLGGKIPTPIRSTIKPTIRSNPAKPPTMLLRRIWLTPTYRSPPREARCSTRATVKTSMKSRTSQVAARQSMPSLPSLPAQAKSRPKKGQWTRGA